MGFSAVSYCLVFNSITQKSFVNYFWRFRTLLYLHWPQCNILKAIMVHCVLGILQSIYRKSVKQGLRRPKTSRSSWCRSSWSATCWTATRTPKAVVSPSSSPAPRHATARTGTALARTRMDINGQAPTWTQALSVGHKHIRMDTSTTAQTQTYSPKHRRIRTASIVFSRTRAHSHWHRHTRRDTGTLAGTQAHSHGHRHNHKTHNPRNIIYASTNTRDLGGTHSPDILYETSCHLNFKAIQNGWNKNYFWRPSASTAANGLIKEEPNSNNK
jgi:hypothetical protein